jgi:hypothetical protein
MREQPLYIDYWRRTERRDAVRKRWLMMAYRGWKPEPPEWTVYADGYRLVVENGAILGLAYGEDHRLWGEPGWVISHLIADAEIRQVTGLPHQCSEHCVCPRDNVPLLYSPYWDEHACPSTSCIYQHGFRKVMRTVTDCPCGIPHESTSDVWKLYDRVQDGLDPLATFVTPAGIWRVPRIYVACHGLRAEELPELAAQYGWEQLAA